VRSWSRTGAGGQAEPKQGGFVTGQPWKMSDTPAWDTVWV